MVDPEPGSYRPRRAVPDPAAEAQPDEPASTPEPANTSEPAFPRLGPLLDEDAPKPLYRDEVAPPKAPEAAKPGSADKPGAAKPPINGPDAPTTVRPITFTPQRRPRPTDDQATTVLPRTRTRTSRPLIEDADDELPSRLGPRTRLAILIASVAAVTVIGIAIAYAVLGVGKTPRAVAPPPTSASATPSSAGPSTPGSGTVLSAPMLLSPVQARSIDPKRSWKVALTQTGAAGNAPSPACFGGDPAEGEPTALEQMAQLLSSNGKAPLGALHLARVYSSPEEATQAFVVASKTLGSCPAAGSYIDAGRVVTGVGDSATGVIINSLTGTATERHTVILARTGRVLNLFDVTGTTTGASATAVATAATAVVRTQCTAAGGGCGGPLAVQAGPPPLGGDEPGYLATGDLPAPRGQVALWTAAEISQPDENFLGSGCEVVQFNTLPAVAKNSRTYLYTESADAFFGVNEIILTMKDRAAATRQAAKIKDNIATCKKRKLTATVTGPTKASSVGAANSAVSGWYATVTQKSTRGPQKYRVGIVSTGTKVIYTFANPKGRFDFTDPQWKTIVLRAGERATQIS